MFLARLMPVLPPVMVMVSCHKISFVLGFNASATGLDCSEALTYVCREKSFQLEEGQTRIEKSKILVWYVPGIFNL